MSSKSGSRHERSSSRRNNQPNKGGQVQYDRSMYSKDDININDMFFDNISNLTKAIALCEKDLVGVKALYDEIESNGELSGKAFESLRGVMNITCDYYSEVLIASKGLPKQLVKFKDNLKQFKSTGIYKGLDEIE